jgi:aspartyl-tRNA(Asn)/glutamyl-tRNA(Gln) amidotransferase subunit C
MISREDIEKLALLSRLKLSEAEKSKIDKEIGPILAYVSEIQSVASQEPMRTAGTLRNVMREDGQPHEPGAHTENIVSEFPQKEGNQLKVKTILSNE